MPNPERNGRGFVVGCITNARFWEISIAQRRDLIHRKWKKFKHRLYFTWGRRVFIDTWNQNRARTLHTQLRKLALTLWATIPPGPEQAGRNQGCQGVAGKITFLSPTPSLYGPAVSCPFRWPSLPFLLLLKRVLPQLSDRSGGCSNLMDGKTNRCWKGMRTKWELWRMLICLHAGWKMLMKFKSSSRLPRFFPAGKPFPV